MLWLKLKAGALQVTLFIGVVIALLLTAFILLVHTHKRFDIQTDFIIETIKNADKGIQYAIDNSISLNDTTTVSLADEDYKSLKLNRDFWGVFERVTSVSKIKNNRIEKSALIGGVSNRNERLALYVQDNDKPFYVAGHTRIEGLVYVPNQAVKSGIIAQQQYSGSQLIYGNIRRSNKLPKIFHETITKIDAIERLVKGFNEDQFLNIEEGKVHKNSFFDATEILFSNSQIHLNEISLIGNIIVQSKTKIVVDESAVLKDIILIAPDIVIKNNVKACFQAIASKEIEVGEGVRLNYPSTLIIKEKNQTNDVGISDNSSIGKIKINSNSKIKGLVVYLGPERLNNYEVQLELAENATIIGEVYCNQNFELNGTVLGSVYTNNFIAKQFGSVYQNHIYNGKIIANDLPKEYVGLSFNNSKKGIAKWLY
ncbi:hypothetical protein [Psychroserpens burtonensis]|uniref:hypothetical protein n=1 Tax=Psychroserpens burtonensis TaxID=49278 RepID=UPI00041FA669|nr:hypothetical protein [Psychroserpens burtonensis]